MLTNSHINLLKSVSLFSKLPESEIAIFSGYANVKDFPKGKILFLQDEPADYFYIIKNGWVKLFSETVNGDEAVIDILTTKGVFGETSIFDGGTYHYGAEVVENSTLLIIPTKLLKERIENNARLATNMISVMSHYRMRQEREIEHLNLQNAPQRIGCFLIKLCREEDTPPIKIHLPYDKSLVAAKLGMKPETFSRALSTLKKETGVQINGPEVLINNLQRMIEYCCNFCSASHPECIGAKES